MNLLAKYKITTKRGDKVIVDIAGKPETAILLREIKSSGEYLVQLTNGTRKALDGAHVFEYYEEFFEDLSCYNFKQFRGPDLEGWNDGDIASLLGVSSLNKTVFWGGAY